MTKNQRAGDPPYPRRAWDDERYYDIPDDPESSFIFGSAVRMLTEGGPWRLDEKVPWHYDFYRPKGDDRRSSIRTTPERIEYYPGEFSEEPDPAISNVKWTGQLINFMAGQGFTLERIEAHLSDPRNLGGAFHRHKRHADPTMLSRYYAGSVAIGNTDPQGTCITNRDSPSWMTEECLAEVGTTRVLRRHALDVLAYLSRNPGAIQNRLREAKVVHPRILRPVLKALVNAGFVTSDAEPVRCAGGRVRRLPVYRVTPAGAALLPSFGTAPVDLWRFLD